MIADSKSMNAPLIFVSCWVLISTGSYQGMALAVPLRPEFPVGFNPLLRGATLYRCNEGNLNEPGL
jgi:hypothetical protein